jgi:hypothetical protein
VNVRCERENIGVKLKWGTERKKQTHHCVTPIPNSEETKAAFLCVCSVTLQAAPKAKPELSLHASMADGPNNVQHQSV